MTKVVLYLSVLILICSCSQTPFEGDGEGFLHDTPASIGMTNAIFKTKQLLEIKWTPLKNVPDSRGGNFLSGQQVTGINYSSVRLRRKFVGFEVSLETFMTAVHNPASVMYTRNLRNSSDPDHHPQITNVGAYYGVVCSIFVLVGYGMFYSYSTAIWNQMPGNVKIDNQSAYGARVGDSLCTHDSGHVMFIEDIIRTPDGRIKTIVVTDSAQPLPRRRLFTPETFDSTVLNEYDIYRNDSIAFKNIEYTPSPFVNVEGEYNTPYIYNNILGLNYGNKCLLNLGQEIEINVMQTVTNLIIQKKNGANWDILQTAPYSLIPNKIYNKNSYKIYSFTPTDAGEYRAYCTMQSGDSDYQHFDVAQVASDSPTVANGKFEVSFSCSDNVQPLWIEIANSKIAAVGVHELTDSEILDGKAVINFKKGNYFVRVHFKGLFGGVVSELKQIIIN